VAVFCSIVTIPPFNLQVTRNAAKRAADKCEIPDKVICDTLGISQSEWSTQKWHRGINYTRMLLLGVPFVEAFNRFVLEEMGDAELPSQREQWAGLKQLQAEYASLRADFSDLMRRVTTQKTEAA
jgi:hypothetical protein